MLEIRVIEFIEEDFGVFWDQGICGDLFCGKGVNDGNCEDKQDRDLMKSHVFPVVNFGDVAERGFIDIMRDSVNTASSIWIKILICDNFDNLDAARGPIWVSCLTPG